MDLNAYEPLLGLAVAVVAGLLIGFEREQSAPRREQSGEANLGGVRTHPLVALVGALAMLLSETAGPWVLLGALGAITTLVAISHAAAVRRAEPGLTSEVTFLVSFMLGALACHPHGLPASGDRALLVIALAVVVTLLLSIKPSLHAFVQKVSREDLFATLKFLVSAVVILPLLPDRAMGPLEALNPRSVGIMAVLIAAVSFVGYVAVRVAGPHRGLAVTGLVGGLVSSTAVTLSFAGRARQTPELAAPAVLAVSMACTVMTVRVMVLVTAAHPPLLPTLALPLGMVVLAGLVVAWVVYRRTAGSRPEGGDVHVTNPFELTSAVKFAALYALVLLVARAAHRYLGTGALYLAGVLAGTTDVDAITLSTARLAAEGLDPRVAATTILLAVFSNTCVKTGIAAVVGGWAFGRRVAAALGITVLAGAAGLAVAWV